MVDFEGKVGPQALSDGSRSLVRLMSTGELAASQVHARYWEAVRRGTIYSACTGAAGVAPGTALSTTPPLTLYNPKTSGKHLAVLMALMGYISGTLGAGTVVFAVNTDPAAAAPTGGTALTPINALLGGAAGVAQVFQGATLPATPTIYRPFAVLGAFAGGAETPKVVAQDVAGSIIVTPGCALSLQAIADAGTSPLVLLSLVWEEVPI
jgi:hypothetical protein